MRATAPTQPPPDPILRFAQIRREIFSKKWGSGANAAMEVSSPTQRPAAVFWTLSAVTNLSLILPGYTCYGVLTAALQRAACTQQFSPTSFIIQLVSPLAVSSLPAQVLLQRLTWPAASVHYHAQAAEAQVVWCTDSLAGHSAWFSQCQSSSVTRWLGCFNCAYFPLCISVYCNYVIATL